MNDRIPVTVLGGYLGSGKTTRVNRLLSEWEGDPIAVVVNDFGAINVDASLITSQDADLMELANGCVCCSLVDGMAATMEQIAAMERRPGHVVIEVSGVGDPAGVAHWGRTPGFELNAVLVCADAETVQRRARDRWVADTVVAQLTSADLVALTKTDLVSEAHSREVEEWLHETVPGVRVTDTDDVMELLIRTGPVAGPREPGQVRSDEATHHAQAHRSWSAVSSEPVARDKVAGFLAALPEPVVRAKGVLRTVEAPDVRTVVQMVGRRIEWSQDGPWPDGPHESTLVVITSGDPSVPTDLGQQVERALR